MRAVVDANILVRAIIKPQGTVGPILGRLRDGDYTLLYTDSLMAELADVLRRPRIRNKYGINDNDVETILALILLRGEAVTPTRSIMVCRDPKDNQVLEAAVGGRAGVIVSGDDDLLILHPFEGIPIISLCAFLALLPDSEKP